MNRLLPIFRQNTACRPTFSAAASVISRRRPTDVCWFTVSGYDASMLLSVLLYLIPTAVLLRKKKLPEVQLYWHQYVKK